MKFARYLEDTQTPEWKRAYIDYRGLKKRITRIRNENESEQWKNSPVPSPVEADSAGPSDSVVRQSEARSSNASIDSVGKLRSRGLQTPEKPDQDEGTHALRRSLTARFKGRRMASSLSIHRGGHQEPMPLNTLLTLLTVEQKKFFEALDIQLAKIEQFYVAREKDLRERSTLLESQLNELRQHRENFHSAQAKRAKDWARFKLDPLTALLPAPLSKQKGKGVSRESSISPPRHVLDPDEYHTAKKRLKKAVVEHYRLIELLHNYRVLNMTGFRKALKKFEKVTGIPAQRPYMTEKVETSAFSTGHSLRAMMNEMELLYTSRFARGNRKIAMAYLRGVNAHKTHHFSSFRTGLLLGVALPALVSGIYKSFQPETRESIVGWDGLLFVYGVLFIPVLFSLLVGMNLVIWARSHINYVFIFELNPRTRLDYREYFEIPAILLTTLCCAFWLSFFEVGSPGMLPIWWPLVWLGVAFGVMFNPFNFWAKSSRLWFLRNVGRLLISGTRPVEFADFWMGDQFCSLAFTLSNLYLFACSYHTSFEEWQKCGSSSNKWPVAFSLAMLPSLVRLVQSVRRFADSGLETHLVNAGKYGAGIVYYLCYFAWRHHGGPHHTPSFVAFCVFGTVNSVYTTTWDFLMDWSLLRPHSQHTLLRSEIIYSGHVPMYYVAMLTNLLIRFIWVIYIPTTGPSIYLRQFIAGLLEVLRRWQWNFYRLENEHLGNMDQYRVSREVPLPYPMDENSEDRGDDDDDDNN